MQDMVFDNSGGNSVGKNRFRGPTLIGHAGFTTVNGLDSKDRKNTLN